MVQQQTETKRKIDPLVLKEAYANDPVVSELKARIATQRPLLSWQQKELGLWTARIAYTLERQRVVHTLIGDPNYEIMERLGYWRKNIALAHVLSGEASVWSGVLMNEYFERYLLDKGVFLGPTAEAVLLALCGLQKNKNGKVTVRRTSPQRGEVYLATLDKIPDTEDID